MEFDLLEWLTGPKPLVSAEEEDWQFACFEWLLRNTRGFGRFANAVAVLPTDAFFPQKGLRFPALQLAISSRSKPMRACASGPALDRASPAGEPGNPRADVRCFASG